MEKRLFGFEWTHELEEGIVAHASEISCMEIIPENFFEGRFSQFIEFLRNTQVPVAVHGVHLSIGSMEPLKEDHLAKVLEVADQINMINYSDHLALTEVGGLDLDALTPLAFNIEVADVICRKVEQVQKKIKVPFLIENVSNRFIIPDSDLTEVEFINYILQHTGCGLLLDITNVYTNALNFGFDAKDWIDQIDPKKVELVHLAGGTYDADGFLMDSHDNTVADPSWELYEYFCRKRSNFTTIIERTGNCPPFEFLRQELLRAKSIASTEPPISSWSENEVVLNQVIA